MLDIKKEAVHKTFKAKLLLILFLVSSALNSRHDDYFMILERTSNKI